jgi:hypothetical protein
VFRKKERGNVTVTVENMMIQSAQLLEAQSTLYATHLSLVIASLPGSLEQRRASRGTLIELVPTLIAIG